MRNRPPFRVFGCFMLGLLYSVFSEPAKAEGVDVLVGAWSYHYNRDAQRNEQHNLLGVCYSSVCAGSMTNSYGVKGITVFYDYSTPINSHLSVGWRAGVLSGYEGTPVAIQAAGFMPMAGATASLEITHGVHVEATVTPMLSLLNFKVSL